MCSAGLFVAAETRVGDLRARKPVRPGPSTEPAVHTARYRSARDTLQRSGGRPGGRRRCGQRSYIVVSGNFIERGAVPRRRSDEIRFLESLRPASVGASDEMKSRPGRVAGRRFRYKDAGH